MPGLSWQEILVWVTIVGVSLTTFVTRGSFVLLGSRIKLPSIVDRALGYAPACALAAILAPDLAFDEGTLRLDWHNPRLVAAAIAALGFVWSRSMLLTIGLGMLAFTLLRVYGNF